MTNQDHIEIFKQGVKHWNRWRVKNPLVKPDLSFMKIESHFLDGINLSFTNLHHTSFKHAHLANANLDEAQCSQANFTKAFFQRSTLIGSDFSFAHCNTARFYNSDLSYANFNHISMQVARFTDSKLAYINLEDAHLEHADFQYADLTNARCSHAHFDHADLSNCRLIGAQLFHANLSNACIGNTHFGDRDFRSIKGLDTTWHSNPSPLSINSLYLSQGNIPESFIRGTGAPELFVAYLQSLTSKPMEYYSCFMSYAHPDRIFAERLYTDLQNKGVRCWFAPEDIKIGDHYHQSIDESIRQYDKLVLILSRHALQSSWVEREVLAAIEKEEKKSRIVLFPLRLDDTILDTPKAWAANVRRRWHIGDFCQWKDYDAYQSAFERLLRDLKTEQKAAE